MNNKRETNWFWTKTLAYKLEKDNSVDKNEEINIITYKHLLYDVNSEHRLYFDNIMQFYRYN